MLGAVVYALRVGKLDLMEMLSLVTTWAGLGMKVSKVSELNGLWKYRQKQKRKVKSLAAIQRAVAGGDAGSLLSDESVDGGMPDTNNTDRDRVASIEMVPPGA